MLKFIWTLLLITASLICPTSYAQQHQAAIATAHPLATQAGFDILNQGGNAFDAAVAISAALAVVEPTGSGLGGGGFWLLHRAHDGFEVMLDGRETAPSQAHRFMYLDQHGQFDKHKSLNGPLAAAIPGVPAALDYLANNYGKLPLKTSLAPAIHYAETGFKIGEHYRKLAQFRLNALIDSPAGTTIFLNSNHVPDVNSLLIQTDLANTLRQLAQSGRDGFYQGDIAEKLVTDVQKHGGIWTLDDLANYTIKLRQPIKGSYLGYTITSSALPSSGGIALLSMLNQLEQLPLTEADSVQRKHLISEVMRRAYYDRSRYLGDVDFVSVPTKKLISKSYSQQLASSIDLDHASDFSSFAQRLDQNKGEDTTHFSVIDHYGNRVSATLSINYPFGSGFVPAGTGVLLNDEMDDFSAKTGTENVYGLLGTSANAITANKRPLSSMTPTFVENDKQLMIIGTPGGSRIITMVLLGILDFIDDKSAQEIVSSPRFHHQYSPNSIQVESSGFSDDELNQLKRYGHDIKQLDRQYGNMQVIIFDKTTQQLSAVSDPRGEGEAGIRHITVLPLHPDALVINQ
ncbi:MAG: gamma-glutamyltransferase [Gammaproteobacteria bacterium]|nr:gamma-glutamyltransferase [Gammaproteobacteria bacterium]